MKFAVALILFTTKKRDESCRTRFGLVPHPRMLIRYNMQAYLHLKYFFLAKNIFENKYLTICPLFKRSNLPYEAKI